MKKELLRIYFPTLYVDLKKDDDEEVGVGDKCVCFLKFIF